jgi:hypothetical protein
MGQHDPLDGFVVVTQLRATGEALQPAPPAPRAGPRLDDELADFGAMMEGRDWTTSDPLGLGALLMDASLVQQLAARGAFPRGELQDELLAAALGGLSEYAREGELDRPAAARLAFRELGLAIGLQAAEGMQREAAGPPRAVEREDRASGAGPETRRRLEAILAYAPLRGRIESFWLDPEHRRAPSWTEHRDINEVMLATSLVPDGCLRLPPID